MTPLGRVFHSVRATLKKPAVARLLLLLALAVPLMLLKERAGQTQSTGGQDLPGFGGESATPFLYVQLDTSASMRFDPNYNYEYPFEDYNPTANYSDGGCDSKFCAGKQALYNVLSANSSFVEIGLGGYFESYETINTPAVNSAYSFTCQYDVLAAPDATYSSTVQTFKSTIDYAPLDDAGTWFGCNLEGDDAGIKCSTAELPGTNFTVGGYSGTHLCMKTAIGGGNTLEYYQNPNCKGGVSPTACSAPTSILDGGITYNQASGYPQQDLTYPYNVEKSQANQGLPCTTLSYLNLTSGPNGAGCSAAYPCDYYLDTADDPGLLQGTITATSGTTATRYTSLAVPFDAGGITYTSQGDTQTNIWVTQVAGATVTSATTCPTTTTYTTATAFFDGGTNPGCATAPTAANGGGAAGCYLSGGTGAAAAHLSVTVGAGTNTAYTPNLVISTPAPGYTVNMTPTSSTPLSYTIPYGSSCNQDGGTVFTVTTNTYPSAPDSGTTATVGCGTSTTSFGSNPCVLVEGSEVDNSDLGTKVCNFTRNTYTYTDPGTTTTTYYCAYQLNKYTYTFSDQWCQYLRTDYEYTNTSFTYKWLTAGGEIVGTYTSPGFTNVTDDNVCSTDPASTYSSDCKDYYLANSDGGPAACHATGAWGCKLRAQTGAADGGSNRYGYSNPTAGNGATSTYCIASDGLLFDGGGMISTSNTKANWCSETITTAGTPASSVTNLVAGYYQLDAGNVDSGPNVSWSPGLHTWMDTGMGLYLDGGVDGGGTPAVSFTPIASLSASAGGPVLQMLSQYTGRVDGGVQPLWMPIVGADGGAAKCSGACNPATTVNGDFTPLYGSLRNIKDYLQGVMNNDPYAGCRGYYVMLVTDGEEATPANYQTSDDVAAVTALTTMQSHYGSVVTNVPVKVFIVGFGAGIDFSNLNAMAVAGGEALDGGLAYSAANASILNTQLNQILGTITAGTYTRTKPVLTNAGTRVYAGYFEHSNTGLEWPGFVDAYSVINGVISGSPIWQLSTQLNAMANNSRTLYTHTSNTAIGSAGTILSTGLTDFDVYGNVPSPVNCTLVKDITGASSCTAGSEATANSVISFVRDDNGSTQYFQTGLDAGTSTQRLSRLGDDYHSTPAAIANPIFTSVWGVTAAEKTAYQAFQNTYSNREPTVYVGTNDGILHAVRDDPNYPPNTTIQSWAGNERWGYVPHSVLSNLGSTMQGHYFTTDGNLAISDVCLSPTACADQDGSGWETVLVGSLGWGGRGLFALNITNASAPVWLWDYENQTGEGSTWSGPVIARVETGTTYKFGAFVGGGFSTTASQGNAFFIIDIATGIPMTDGTTSAYWPINSVNIPATKDNVPARPLVIRPNDGSMASVAFFGDTDSNLWRMEVTATQISSWTPVNWFSPFKTPACGNTALPALPDETGTVTAGTLPLTVPGSTSLMPQLFNRPVTSVDDAVGGTGRNVIYLGTGNAEAPTTTTTQDYFFAIRDDSDVLPAESCFPQMLWGYKLGLGEKVLSDPAFIGNNIIVPVYHPPSGAASCGATGSSELYCFNKITGAPNACITPPATVANPNPSPVSSYSPPTTGTGMTAGIISDLTIVGSTLLWNGSSSPNTVNSAAVVPGPVPFQVKTWQRVQ